MFAVKNELINKNGAIFCFSSPEAIHPFKTLPQLPQFLARGDVAFLAFIGAFYWRLGGRWARAAALWVERRPGISMSCDEGAYKLVCVA